MSLRILGLDPGLRSTGWGIIEMEGNRLIHIAHGMIQVPSTDPIAQRLYKIHHSLMDVFTTYAPHEMALEETFVNKNPGSSLKLGYARGVILMTAGSQGIDVFEYAATTIKKSVVGSGHAPKEQVEAMVKMLLPASKSASKDAADALAIAICHGHNRDHVLRLQELSLDK